MASFDTSKIVSDIKAGKITSKEPPKYIFEKNPRNNRKVKKLNPRWTAWSKRQKNKEIDKKVETYVKKNQKGQKINKDLTKDSSKKKVSGVGPTKDGDKYANKLKANKKGNTSTTTAYKPRSEAKVIKDKKAKSKANTPKRTHVMKNYIRHNGKIYSRKSRAGKELEKKLKIRKR